MQNGLVVVLVLAGCGGLAALLVRLDWPGLTDSVRRRSPLDAQRIEQQRFTLENPAALPMHDRSFDPPGPQ